jgi:hypothetical protein
MSQMKWWQMKYTILVILVILAVYFLFSNATEGFTVESTREFLRLQRTINPNTNFDMKTIGKQASQEEMDYYLKHQMWPWTNELKEMYKGAILSNPHIRLEPGLAINSARVIYNESIMWQILSWQTKEGQFLLNGVIVKDPSSNEFPSGFGDFPYSSELTNEKHDVVKCDNNGLMRTRNIGIDRNGAYITKQFPVELGTLDKLIPGFSFITDKSGCNPCIALNDSPVYSCPFKLDVMGVQPGVSSVWQHLWKVS